MRYNDFKQIISEGSNLAVSELLNRSGRVDLFLNKVKSNQPFELVNGGSVTVDPSEYNRIKQVLVPGAKGQLKVKTTDGEMISTAAFKKTADFGGLSGKEGKVANKGEVAEGILGAATMARLIKRPGTDVTVDDVYTIIKQLPNTTTGGVLTKNAPEGDSISDVFEFTIKLKPATYKDFKDEKKWPIVAGIAKSIVKYVNSNVKLYSNFFEQNGRPDKVEVVSDGVSDETSSKTDVYMVYRDENGERRLQHFDLSAKTGTTNQIGQVGSGGARASAEKQYEIIRQLFNRFGADVSPIENKFVAANTVEKAYEYAYKQAAIDLKNKLKGMDDDVEQSFLKQLINGIKYFATLNNDKVKLVQFTDTGYFVLDFKKLDRLFNNDQINLSAAYKLRTGGGTTPIPVVSIYDKISGQELLAIRMFRSSGGYIRTYIEKGNLLKKITRVRTG
jgi:hypothetical protein